MLATKERIIADRSIATERYILQTLPLLYLPLWKSDGSSQFLSSDGHGHLCTVTGALWTPQGRKFDDNDDQIEIPSFEVIDFTIAVWVKRTATGGFDFVGNKWEETGDERVWQFLIRNTDVLTFAVSKTGAAAGDTSLNSSGTIDATWHLIQATYKFIADGTSEIRFCIDGAIDATVSNTAVGPPFVTTESILFGYRKELNNPFGGMMGEVWMWSRAFDGQESSRLYEATRWRYQ
ncbi:hypothetical protein LCGC14_1391190 [marine sediment metagenome]|uniref:LamG-like jellyroll fold domain-containing protein n=1 Tax=marine sediment metagenome TaxID=412755 RepID=A0A0F9KKR6_9ZZZZ